MKKFKVTARATSYATLEVEAASPEEALQIAAETDGGDFTPCSDALGGWDIDPEVEELGCGQCDNCSCEEPHHYAQGGVPVFDLSDTVLKPVHILDSDQPTTCPECGARTELVEEISEVAQLHECLKCHYRFIGELDDE